MSEALGLTDERKAALKRLIGALHEGADPQQAKRQFAEILGGLTAEDIARIEEEMINEGMPRAEVQRLCDVHLAVFKDSLEPAQDLSESEYPVQILMKEHELLLELAAELNEKAMSLASSDDPALAAPALQRVAAIGRQFRRAESHYQREENVLFPHLERHGVVEPPAIMWSEHDRIRSLEKEILAMLDAEPTEILAGSVDRLAELAANLNSMLASHFYKENNILYPTAVKLFSEPEWREVGQGFGEIGYWRVRPVEGPAAEEKKPAPMPSSGSGDLVSFASGAMSHDILEALLNTMPVDVTFVDAQDTVRYFSQGKERVFPRTTAIIGRKVQQCHPEKSVHVVSQILNDFRSGARDTADFWIQSNGRFLSIRYFAVRNNGGEYLGCLEVTQDATAIRSLEGEKRLLDSQ